MGRHRLSVRIITDAAVTVVDVSGPDALTISSVAKHLEVGPSALYSHVDGLEDLRQATAHACMGQLSAQVKDAAVGVTGRHALIEMANAYRRYALAHPARFVLLSNSSRARPGQAEPRHEIHEALKKVLKSVGVAPERVEFAAQSADATIHGYISLNVISGHRTTAAQKAQSHTATREDEHLSRLIGVLIDGLQAEIKPKQAHP